MVEAVKQTATTEDARRLGHWTFILAALVALLIAIGGVVRLSGSGLSIPDWPLIRGSLLPPLNQSDWQLVYDRYYAVIHGDVGNSTDGGVERMAMPKFRVMFAIEYTHRLVAALVGIVFLAVAVQLLRLPTLRRRHGRAIILLGTALLSQAILGGIVVKFDLRTELVALHLGLAFVFFSLILWLALTLCYPNAADRLAPAPCKRVLHGLCWLAIVVVFIQILSGGMVAGSRAGFQLNSWPRMGGHLIPPLELIWSAEFEPPWFNLFYNPIWIQFFHRWWAIAALLVVSLLPLTAILSRSMTTLGPAVSWLLRALLSVLVFQVLLGILTLITRVQPLLALLHLLTALLLSALLIALAYLLRGRKVVRS